MDLIKNKQNLLTNIKQLDIYLDRKCDPEYSFALDLIKKGTCFVALSNENSVRFYPSRFIGYMNNTMESHLSNERKDGRETTPLISSIINNGQPPKNDTLLESLYFDYCAILGFTAREKGSFGVQRKYWKLEM